MLRVLQAANTYVELGLIDPRISCGINDDMCPARVRRRPTLHTVNSRGEIDIYIDFDPFEIDVVEAGDVVGDCWCDWGGVGDVW